MEGYGAFSSQISILAAARPSKPNAPTTTWIKDFVIISWS